RLQRPRVKSGPLLSLDVARSPATRHGVRNRVIHCGRPLTPVDASRLMTVRTTRHIGWGRTKPTRRSAAGIGGVDARAAHAWRADSNVRHRTDKASRKVQHCISPWIFAPSARWLLATTLLPSRPF